MLSVKAFGASSSATLYYSHGDYYGSEGVGVWYGEGTKDLGFQGTFNAKDDKNFANILDGRLPNGEFLGKKTKDGLIHRPGIDMTFSSPKSISIEMLICATPEERKTLENARDNALKSTLDFIAKEGYIFTRKGAQGKDREDVHNLTFALFKHSTNRNSEPHDHVHCFLANVAKCSDSKYRSICWDRVFENNKNIGQYFRNFYALEVQKIGYEIRHKDLGKNGSSFELAKVDDRTIKAFSTRRKEIEELYKKYNVTSSKGRDAIVINSRKAKQTHDEAILKSAWKALLNKVEQENKAEMLALENKSLMSSIVEKLSNILELPKSVKENEANANNLSLKQLVDIGIKDVSHYKTVFSKDELLAKTCKYGVGKYSPSVLSKEIDKRIAQKELILQDKNLTVKELIDKEKDILTFAKNGVGKHREIVKAASFEAQISSYAKALDFKLNSQQKEAVKHVLTSKDTVTIINGLPGVGKSTVLDAVRAISKDKAISTGSAPTASAAKTLKKSSGIESTTLHSFLGKNNGYIEDRGTKESLLCARSKFKNSLVIVDESSLISTRQMWKLFKLSSKFGFRVVLVGDKNQLPSVEAGKPFEQLLSVIKPAEMTDILRQKNDSHAQAVIASTKGEISRTIAIHKENIMEARKIVKNTVESYFSLDPMKRANTLIMSPSRVLRDEINEKIKDRLKKAGELTGKIRSIDVLKQKDLTIADYSFARSYTKGDVIKFYKSFNSVGIKKGDYLKVTNVHEPSNALIFSKGIRKIRFALKAGSSYESKLEAFTEAKLELQQGLKVRITKNNAEFGLVNSESAVIQSINTNTVHLKLEDRSSLKLPISELKHVDYGYCSTVHSAEGKTAEIALGAISADNKYLNSQKLWTVLLSRHTNKIICIVDSISKLTRNLQRNTGEQKSAMEFARQEVKSETKASGGFSR